jgi:RecA-family ATPase
VIDWKNYDGPDKIISSIEMDMLLQENPGALLKVKSRIPSLDKACDGFQTGELITISGPTKNGKTLLAQTLTVAFVKQQHHPLWFSYEVPARQFLSQFQELPLFYMPQKNNPHVFEWLENKMEEAFVKYNTRIVFIDHLHYIFDLMRSRNASIDIGVVIRKLKRICTEREFLVFLLCHTTKGSADKKLDYNSIRDSSFVGQESDCVIMIKRTPTEDHPNYAKASVEFHRRTGVMQQMVYLEKQNGHLVERAKHHGEDFSKGPTRNAPMGADNLDAHANRAYLS